MILSLFLSRGLGKSRAHKNLKTKKVFYHNSKTHQSSIPNTRKSNRYRKNINIMPRTVYPADSASQVSTNRGSLLGRQPGQQGHRNQNDLRTSLLGQASARGIQGSALGRSADTNLRPRGKSSLTNVKLDVELELTRLVDLRGGDRVSTLRGSAGAAGDAVSERSLNQLNQSFEAMNVNPGVNIDIQNNKRMASQSLAARSLAARSLAPRSLAPRSLAPPRPVVHHSQSIVQYTPQAAPADDHTTQKRFIAMTQQSTPMRLGNLLCDVFKVQSEKVHEWLKEGLIRVDSQKWNNGVFPYDIEPLTAQLTAKDIDKWDHFVRGYDSDRELQKAIGTGEGSFIDFERDFGGGRSSRDARGPGLETRYGRYDPRCRSCAFRRAYCGGVDVFHTMIRGAPRRW